MNVISTVALVLSCAVGRSLFGAARLGCGAVLFLALLLSAGPAPCATVAWWQHPQREQLEIVFAQDLPTLDVRRIDPLTVRIQTEENAWGPRGRLTLPAFTGANYLESMIPEGPGMLVRLQSKAFGFVTQYDEDSRRLTIDFFPDPLGGRWLFDPPAPARPAAPEKPLSREAADDGSDVEEKQVHSPLATQAAPVEPAPAAKEPRPTPRSVQADSGETGSGPGHFTGPARDPGALSVRETPSPGEVRFRIERTGPEDALPAQTDPARPPAAAADAADPSRAVLKRPEAPEPAMPEAFQVRGEITRPDPQAADVEPERPEPGLPPEKAEEPDLPGPDLPDQAAEGPPAPVPPVEEIEPASRPETPEPGPDPTDVKQKPDDLDERFQVPLNMARTAMMNGEFEEAEKILSALASRPGLSGALREEVLYDLADARFSLHLDNLAAHFASVAGAYEQAMNANPKSPRAATALRNLGVAHLRVDNLPEATAFFNVLRREHPHDPITPTADYYLGDHHLQRGRYDLAADHFETVVERHPEHSIAQESSLGLVRSLYALGYDDRAFQVMDFVEKRWPRYYIDDPALLELAGIISLRVNHLESAGQRLLTYYNLDPDSLDAHMVLARLGDVYLLQGKPEAARHVFEKAASRFPDEEGGLIAQMRLVEGGIHDDPGLDDIFATMKAAQVYARIIEQHPQSPLADVATVKLAIWQVWNKRLEDSLTTVRDFLARRMHHSLAPRAMEVGMEAFSQLVDRNIQDGRHAETVEQWELNDFLHPLEPDLSVETQLGLAMAFWKTGDHERAVQIARPHLRDFTPELAQSAALDLVLGIFLEQQQWEEIAALEPLREELSLSPDRLRELDYALALALENLGRSEQARKYWLSLAEDMGLGESQRGFALYFLAREAMQQQDLEKAYLYSQEALSLMLLESRDSAKIRDCMSWLTQITERTGRFQEALAWALEFDQLIDEDDPAWAMSRYRLAQLYQRVQDHQQWRRTLQDLEEKDPHGLYGRLARSALQGRDLEESVGRFGP